MKLLSAAIRNSLLFIAAFLIVPVFLGTAVAQQTSSTKKEEPTRAKFPAAKAQKSTAPDADEDADADSQSAKKPGAEKDSPDSIRKRDQWFYKQRSSANGHIPAGARAQALAHMQRRMEAEGRMVHRADGSIAEVAAPLAAVTNSWTSIGPTPTTGGEFSPVTGRITAIAVDPAMPPETRS